MNRYHARAASGFFIAAALVSGCSTTNRDWERAEHLGTITGYEEFLGRHSDTDRSKEASQRLAQLRCERAWNAAMSSDTTDSYKDFLSRFPGSRFETDAKTELEATEAWTRTAPVKTIEAYEDYLAKYPAFYKRKMVKELVFNLKADRDWKVAELADSADAYAAFASNYPDSERASTALGRRTKLLEARDWKVAERTNTADCYADFVLKYPDSELGTNAASRLSKLVEDSDWKAALVADSETGWLGFILRHRTSSKITDAVARFQVHERSDARRYLVIAAVEPSFSMGGMNIMAHVTSSRATPTPFTAVASAVVYDKDKKEVSVDTQSMTAERPEAFTVKQGATNLFFCSAGAPSVWKGPQYSHYRGQGLILAYAVLRESGTSDEMVRISNLIIIDADYDKQTAKVLTNPDSNTRGTK